MPRPYHGVGAPRAPALANFCKHPARLLFTVEIMKENGFLKAKVIQRKNIRSHQIENQEHLRGPPPYPADIGEYCDHRFVIHARPAPGVKQTLRKVAGEVDHVFDLSRRKPATSKPLRADAKNRCRRDLADYGYKPPPHGIGGLHRYLLTHDGASQGAECIAPRDQRGVPIALDQRRHHPVAARQRARCFLPVVRTHVAIVAESKPGPERIAQ